MPSIMDFVQMAAQNLGQPEGATKSATAALLGGLRQKADPSDFAQLMGAIPGASDLLKSKAAPDEDSGGGLLGGLMGQATSSMGGGLGGTLGLLAEIQKSGFSLNSVSGLAKLFVQFAKTNAGKALVTKLMGQVPELAKFGA